MISICIPTHNRFPFLEWTMKRLRADFPDAELIFSDNASTDRTTMMVLGADRVIRQRQNIGPFPNMHAALEAATGDYAIYCGDDDYLLPSAVAEAVTYLESHPEVSCYCAPCEIYDEVNQRPFWNAFKFAGPMTFAKADGMELFNFLIGCHVWPEHFIYRVPVAIKPRTEAYWAFVDLPDLLAAGAIHFSPTPFYRNLLVHPVGERVQLGNVQCLTHFEQYRAGLEVLAYGLFGGELPYAARHRIHEMIQWFLCQRMDIAAQLLDQQGKPQEASILRQRLAIASPARDAA